MTYTVMLILSILFFLNKTASTEIYTLSLHDALPISNDFAEKMKEAKEQGKDMKVGWQAVKSLIKGGAFALGTSAAFSLAGEIGRAVQQECRDRSRMPSSA